MLYKIICVTFYIICISNITSVESVEVRTDLGTICGKIVEDDITGACYYSFEGIPYAEAPVGSLRFKPPVKRRPCATIIDATKPGYVCPQPTTFYSREQQSEDCLNLNIYVPANYYMTKFLPVIFYIHGGDFTYLSGNAEPVFGPQLLILNEFVVVTVNYRLGPLGFLSMCTEEVSGNAGLKDVLLALRTIREIIWRFGGDSKKITLMGTGAGAAIAEILLLTKEAEGLFQSVILQSGSVLSTEYMQLNPRENAIALGRELRIDISNDDCMLEALRNINPFEIVEAQEAIERRDIQRGVLIKRFKLVVEINCGSALVTKSPLELIRQGAICNVPILIGFNNQEGVKVFETLARNPELINTLNENFDLLIPVDIKYPYGSGSRRKLTNQIRDFYFNGGNISITNVQNYVNYLTDILFSFPIDFMVQEIIKYNKVPLYLYIFEADTNLNWYKAKTDITYPGAAHLDDLGYVFLTSITKPKYQCLEPTTKYIQTTQLLNIKYFVYYGVPAPNPNVNTWPLAGPERNHIIHDYTIIPIYHRPLKKRTGFWASVYEEYFNSRYYNTATYFCTNVNIRDILQ